jgi:tRNA (guanine37-N1)-methyltransferase
MRFDLISAVPDLLRSPLEHSIVKKARDKGLLDVHIHDLRDYSEDKHRKVDDTPYGGGPGMVLTPQPINSCIESLKAERDYDEILFMAPDGIPFTQAEANKLSGLNRVIILCGHYKGVDQRIRDHVVTKEYSLGDFVLSGGELPALVIVDAVARLLPGVLGDAVSALNDSFQDGLLDCEAYSRPAEFNGWKVPETLLSGDHAKIEAWRHNNALERTKRLRPDLYDKFLNEH